MAVPLVQATCARNIQPAALQQALFLLDPLPSSQTIKPAPSLLHLIAPSLRHAPVVQFLLQPRNLLQALRVPDQPLHPLPLLLRQLDPICLVARAGAAVGEGRGGDVEGAGFDAHDLSDGDEG